MRPEIRVGLAFFARVFFCAAVHCAAVHVLQLPKFRFPCFEGARAGVFLAVVRFLGTLGGEGFGWLGGKVVVEFPSAIGGECRKGEPPKILHVFGGNNEDRPASG